jgi:hypothetical protein
MVSVVTDKKADGCKKNIVNVLKWIAAANIYV